MSMYKLTVEIFIDAMSMVEAGVFVGKALQGAEGLNIIEFEEFN